MKQLDSNEPLLVIIGPSGSGKSTVSRLLYEKGLIELTPSWTTRPPRFEELAETIEHTFVSKKEFDKKVKSGFFIHSVQLFNLPYWYGLPKINKPERCRIPVIILRAALIPILSKYYTNYKIYQIIDTQDRIEERLRERSKNGELMGLRIEEYKDEIIKGKIIADKLFYNDSDIRSLSEQIEIELIKDFKDIL